MDVEEDVPTLPADTLLLLEQFNKDKDASTKRFEEMKNQAEEAFENGTGKLSMDLFGEDWNASQFWYTEETARTLASELLDGADETSAIALVSAPSAYVALRNLLAEREVPAAKRPRIVLLEYDERFAVLGSDFVRYDFKQPLRLPSELIGTFDRILCDPPYLSEDCQAKTAITVRKLSRHWTAAGPEAIGAGLKFISCTGERMEHLILKLYNKIGAKTTNFDPEHSKGLSNEFRCYANFTCDRWTWR